MCLPFGQHVQGPTNLKYRPEVIQVNVSNPSRVSKDVHEKELIGHS